MSAATALPLRQVWECMGTVFSLDVRGAGVDLRVVDELMEFTHRVDATYSTYRPDSVVSRLNRGDLRRQDCDAEVQWVLGRCGELSAQTEGYFSATATGQLDPSGFVKGWAIATVSDRLERAGSTDHCVNGGGDVQCVGFASPERPWRIGIADPINAATYVAVVEGAGRLAVATSGGAERGAHIVDPHTGSRTSALASVTVVGADISIVDAYATACAAMGPGCLDWIEQNTALRAMSVDVRGVTAATRNW